MPLMRSGGKNIISIPSSTAFTDATRTSLGTLKKKKKKKKNDSKLWKHLITQLNMLQNYRLYSTK